MHLVAGAVAGLFIAVMSITGVMIAFEAEILAYLDREVSQVEPPPGQPALPIDALLHQTRATHAGFETASLHVPSAPDRAYRLSARGGKVLYINPYTGEATSPPSAFAHDVLHLLEEVHVALAFEGEAEAVGRFIQGSANLALTFLCVSGVVLWFPRKWTRKTLRPMLTWVRTQTRRARDFNLHAVFGFWSVLILLVVSASALTFSFTWAHELVFRIAGDEVPKQRGFGMLLVPPKPVPTPREGDTRLSWEEAKDLVAQAFPGHDALVLSLPKPDAEAAERPLDVHALMPDLFATRGRVLVQVDPYRGDILSNVAFKDRSLGLRARVWLRFLHTGEAFGIPGKILACLASLASLVLVYTGFTLMLRRRFGWRP